MKVLNQYVFHFTGKLNQSYVMEKPYSEAVYKADCAGLTLFKDTTFYFRNCLTGSEEEKKVGKTITRSIGAEEFFSFDVSSYFTIDKVPVWDILRDMGLDFEFSMKGICPHYDIYKHGEYIGYAELGGTGLFMEKYKNNKLGQFPSNGIFKVECAEEDIPEVFLACFTLSRTVSTIDGI